jgi:hypothetical protein
LAATAARFVVRSHRQILAWEHQHSKHSAIPMSRLRWWMQLLPWPGPGKPTVRRFAVPAGDGGPRCSAASVGGTRVRPPPFLSRARWQRGPSWRLGSDIGTVVVQAGWQLAPSLSGDPDPNHRRCITAGGGSWWCRGCTSTSLKGLLTLLRIMKRVIVIYHDVSFFRSNGSFMKFGSSVEFENSTI